MGHDFEKVSDRFVQRLDTFWDLRPIGLSNDWTCFGGWDTFSKKRPIGLSIDWTLLWRWDIFWQMGHYFGMTYFSEMG